MKTIMVVDDEVGVVELLKRVIEANGYQVVTCRNGQEALEELAKGHHIDLVVMDLLMPVMDGYELYMILKENEETRNIPILVLTVEKESASAK